MQIVTYRKRVLFSIETRYTISRRYALQLPLSLLLLLPVDTFNLSPAPINNYIPIVILEIPKCPYTLNIKSDHIGRRIRFREHNTTVEEKNV